VIFAAWTSPEDIRKFPNMDVRDRHDHGWNGCLDKLEKLAAAR